MPYMGPITGEKSEEQLRKLTALTTEEGHTFEQNATGAVCTPKLFTQENCKIETCDRIPLHKLNPRMRLKL